jgi:hypothetical protein
VEGKIDHIGQLFSVTFFVLNFSSSLSFHVLCQCSSVRRTNTIRFHLKRILRSVRSSSDA